MNHRQGLTHAMRESRDILEKLIAFPTVSERSNHDIIAWVEELLSGAGFTCRRVESLSGEKSGLYATLGPEGPGGLLMSSHSDVVPVEGQAWTRDAFEMIEDDGKLYGRGTTDMKGFLACSLAAALRHADRPLKTPLKLSVSYDEEIGCVGIREMNGDLEPSIGLPDCCIVGEPTSLAVATGHKGKLFLRATCRGTPGHTAMAPDFLNALHLATDLVTGLRGMQEKFATSGARDEGYEVPYTTIHVAKIAGGIAANIVPEHALVEFEVRHLAADDPRQIVSDLRKLADAIAAPHRARFPAAAVEIEELKSYPGLDIDRDHEFVATVLDASHGAKTTKVAYGTEAGFFSALGIPTVVCGPGNMDQGHRPDEFIARSQLDACDAMLDALIARVCL
ncbi:acetylornithine deacetylase [Tepidamorphus sp. 3E244]|uniref:acetylornithine deacetylase n=1 Tax=Tepidamorphus sp. 3E244 TaxID=3385498 RepID=UPI0038FC52BB